MPAVSGSPEGLSIKVSGGLLELEQFIFEVTQTVKTSIPKSINEEGPSIAEAIKTAITKQVLNHAPLNRKYRARKIKKGYDPRIGIKTGAMLKAVKFFKDSDDEFFIGIRSKKKVGKGKSKLPIVQYARIFEFGSRKQPARPFIRPVFKQRVPKLAKTIKSNAMKSLQELVSRWSKL